MDYAELAGEIKRWGAELGFQAVGIAGCDLASAEPRLLEWLARGWHGEMDYMARHAARRARPAELVSGTLSAICCRLNYASSLEDERPALADGRRACVARYARGRDYHRLMRSRLQRLAEHIGQAVGAFRYRAFADSAPVLEVELATRAGLGWRGKHTLLLDRTAGSWFFLGELYTDLPLPSDAPASDHCGSCDKCVEVCPTRAIRAPYQLDARRCISYLTIELKGSIPVELRPLIGNRVYGCDDCQLACPWNSFAQVTTEPDFAVRNGLDKATLVDLFAWSAEQFDARMAGSAIRRIGYERWLRNLAVGLGNAPASPEVIRALRERSSDNSALVREHVQWALGRLVA